MTISDYRIPFGKHKGETLDDVPASYLLWLEKQDWAIKFPKILEYVQANRKALEEDTSDWEGNYD